jgi:hypothetical protein
MAKQFVMTLKVPLPDDIFEHATVMTGIKDVVEGLMADLQENIKKFDVTSSVITQRLKKVDEA